MRRVALLVALAVLLVGGIGGARAQEADETAIRTLVSEWYAEHRKGEDGRPYRFHAPGAIDASPGYTHVDTGARSLGPRIYHSLAADALEFRHEITRLDRDARFARVHVRERGYFYAAAVQRTYERMGSAVFVLEKQDDGRWLVLAHESNSVGFPPSLATDPMPDLRDLYYATEGRDRDPEADARNVMR